MVKFRAKIARPTESSELLRDLLRLARAWKTATAGLREGREDPPPDGLRQTARTCAACGPLGPWVTLYSTFWFSSRLRYPFASIAEK